MSQFKRRKYVKPQTSPLKETSPQVLGSRREILLRNQTGNRPVQVTTIPFISVLNLIGNRNRNRPSTHISELSNLRCYQTRSV